MAMTLADIRTKYPQYKDVDDQRLADALYQKYYSHADRREFDARVGLKPYDSALEATGKAVQGVPGNWQIGVSGVQQQLREGAAGDPNAVIDRMGQGFKLSERPGLDEVNLLQWARQSLGLDTATPLTPEQKAQVEALASSPEGKASFTEFIASGQQPLGTDRRQVAMSDLKGQLERQELQKSVPAIDVAEGSPEAVVSGAIGSVAQMAPGYIASAVTRNPVPAVALAQILTQGQTYSEARDAGVAPDKAAEYALSSSFAEAVGEAVPLGMILREGGGKLLPRLFKAGVSEALQEGVTQFIQSMLQNGYIDPDMTWGDVKNQVVTAMATGAVAGGVLTGAVAVADAATNRLKPTAESVSAEVFAPPQTPAVEPDAPIENQMALPAPDVPLALPSPEDFAPPAQTRRQGPAPVREEPAPPTSDELEYQVRVALQRSRQAETRELLDTARETITPLGTFSAEEVGGPAAQRVNQLRVQTGRSLDAPITIAELARAKVPQDRINAIIAARRPKTSAEPLSAEDVLRTAAERNIVATDEAFKELALRTTGTRDINRMTQTQLNALRSVVEAMPAHAAPVSVPLADLPSFTEDQYGKAVDAVRAAGRYTHKTLKDATGLRNDKDVKELRDAMVRRGQLVQRGPNDFRLYDVLGSERKATPDDVPQGVMRDYAVRRIPVSKVRVRQNGKSVGVFDSATAAREQVSALRSKEEGAPKSAIAIEPAEEVAWGVIENRYDAEGNLVGQVVVQSSRDEAAMRRAADEMSAPEIAPEAHTRTLRTPPKAEVERTPAAAQAPRRVVPAALDGRVEEVASALNDMARQRGLPLLGARVALRSEVRTPDGRPIEGMYFNKLLSLSVANLDATMSTQQVIDRLAQIMDHELIHALREARVLSPETEGWKTLANYVRKAKRPDTRETYLEWAERNYASERGYENPDTRVEEAIAEAFRHWASNRRNVVGKPATVFSQLAEWFKRLIGAVPEDVFSAIETGKLVSDALRPPGAAEPRARATRAMQEASAVAAVAKAAGDAPAARRASREYLRARTQAREDRYGRSGPKTVLGTTPSTSYETGALMDRAAVGAIADRYRQKAGVKTGRLMTLLPVDETYMQRVADVQQKAGHNPDNPGVAKAYRALIDETRAMWQELGDIKVTAFTGDGSPYASRGAMFSDLSAGRLQLRLSADMFGAGADNPGHPLNAAAGIKTVDGKDLSWNDVLRVVHDVYGHGQSGFNDSPLGRYNAYHEHARLLSPEARRALATETLAQGAWDNFGPHMRRKDGTVPGPTDVDYLPPNQREFAQQKAFLLPDPLVAADPGRALADAASAAEASPRYMVGYHGTPHKVDKFSSEKIGTGEGAQAFGYGLYFAGKREVADFYRQALVPFDKKKHSVLWRGTAVAQDDRPRSKKTAEEHAAKLVADAIELNGETPTEAIKRLADARWVLSDTRGALAALDPADFTVPARGNLYKVDIPEDNELLDWDAPMREQPAPIQRVVENLLGTNIIGDLSGQDVYDSLSARLRKNKRSSFGWTLIDTASDKNDFSGNRAASAALAAAGIPGHRYKDAMSRERGDGSYNYVIYDDSRIQILEENPKFSKFDPVASVKKYRELAGGETEQRNFVDLVGTPSGAPLINGLADARDAAQAHQIADNWVRDIGLKTGVEHLAVLDQAGELVAAGRGTERNVGFPLYVNKAVRTGALRYLTHNHPSNGGLSAADLTSMLTGGAVNKILKAPPTTLTAVGHSGARVSASIGPAFDVSWAQQDWSQVGRMVAMAEAPLYRRFVPLVQGGSLPVETARFVWTHLQNVLMHRLGLIDLRSNGLDMVQQTNPEFIPLIDEVEQGVRNAIRWTGLVLDQRRDFDRTRAAGGIEDAQPSGPSADGLSERVPSDQGRYSKFDDALPGGRLYGNPARSPGGVLSKPDTPSPVLTEPLPSARYFGGEMAEEQLRMAREGERGAVLVYMNTDDFLAVASRAVNPEQDVYDAASAEGYKFSTLPSLVLDGYAGNVRAAESDGAFIARALAGRPDASTLPVVLYPKRPDGLGLVTAIEANNTRVPLPHGGFKEFDPDLRGARYSVGVGGNPAFKRWFGDSKVVDENGRPLVVYHGTTADFEAFKPNVRKGEQLGFGIHFAVDSDFAARYASDPNIARKGKNSRVVSAYLSIKNPLKADQLVREGSPEFVLAKKLAGSKLYTSKDENGIPSAWMQNAIDYTTPARAEKLIREAGFDGVEYEAKVGSLAVGGRGMNLTGKSRSYVAFEPTQIKSVDNQGTFDPADARIRYSINAAPGQRVPNTPPRPMFNIVRQRTETAVGKFLHNLGRSKREVLPLPVGFKSVFDARVKLQDRMLSVKEMLEDIKERGGSIDDLNDTYMLEQLYHGKVFDQIRQREETLQLPLLEALKRAHDGPNKVTPKDFEDYLYALHAPERNAYLRARGSTIDSPSGMTDAEATAILDRLALEGKLPELSGLERMARAVTANTTATRIAGGLISPDTESPFKHYVPLRGFAEEDLDPDQPSGNQTRARSGKGFGVGGREDRSMTGRERKAGDILGHLFLQNTEAVIRAEKNQVALSFMRLLQENPTMGYGTVLKSAPTRRVVGPNGMIHEAGDPTYRQQPDIVTAKHKGREIVARVTDERVARAIKSDYVSSSNDLVNALGTIAGRINRYLATVNTAWNPEFMISNLARDAQTAAILGQQYDIPKLSRKIVGDAPAAMAGIRAVLRDGDISSPWAAAFREMQEAGGTTEFLGIQDLESQVRRIRRSVTKTGLATTPRKIAGYLGQVGKFVDDYNKVAENAFRLAAYKAARDAGTSIPQAAYLAKNLTVNFNKGGEIKGAMNAAYLFYNASVQGSFVLMNGLRNKRVQRLVAGVVVAGLLQDMLNRAISGDEDENGVKDYDDIPDYVLETNFVLMDPTGLLKSMGVDKGYFAFPMPYGFNAFYNLGRNLSAGFSGSPVHTPGGSAASALMTFVDAYNPLGGAQDILNVVAPTLVDPIVDVVRNKDYAGNDIVPERPSFGVPVPNSQKYWSNTGEIPIYIAQQLNALTGGNEVRPGAVDQSPEVLQYGFDYVTGALGKFVQRLGTLALDTGPKALQGDFADIEIGDIPFARRLVGSINSRAATERYYAIAEEIGYVDKELELAKETGDVAAARKLFETKRAEVELIDTFEGVNKTLSDLRKQLRDLRENETVPEKRKREIELKLRAEQDRLMARLTALYFTRKRLAGTQ